MDHKSKIFLISGPTASGKSKFAVKLAEKINGEIINADSMQIYKEIKILNTRPDSLLKKKIKHHLYGFISVKKKFSVAKWIILTNNLIKEIYKRNKTPIIVGGTGLYFKSLTDGLVKIPHIPIKVRNKVINFHKKIGHKQFYKELTKIDPKSKFKLNPNDKQRAIRAYEVKLHTKVSLYDWYKKTKIKYKKDNFEKIYLDFPRNILLKRIERRCSKIINIIGISEIHEFLAQKCNLDVVREKILIKTRQYAKRQVTWARGHMTDWKRLTQKQLNYYLKNI